MDDQIITLTSAQKLNAITWAAKDSGLSYGQYTVGLSMTDKENIYQQYAAILRDRRITEQQMLAAVHRLPKKKYAMPSIKQR